MTRKQKQKRQLFVAWLATLGGIAFLVGLVAFVGTWKEDVPAPQPGTSRALAPPVDRAGPSAHALETVYNQIASDTEKVTVSVASEGARSAVGSGFVVNGYYVLTNHHVIRNAGTLRVTAFHPTRTCSATVVGADEENDLALLRLDTSNPRPSARIGDSGKVDVGDIVFAVGSPFGFGNTFTQGNISDRRQSFTVAGVALRDMLQTNTAIHPGSSGGPLVNLSGEVIGITTVVYTPEGNFTGIGFAVPINRARALLRKAGPETMPADGLQPARLPCAVAPIPTQPGLTPAAMPVLGQRHEPASYRCRQCGAYGQLGCPTCAQPLGVDPQANDSAGAVDYLVCPVRHAVPTAHLAPRCPRCGGPMVMDARRPAAGLAV